MSLERKKIILGISGGIAAYKTVDLVSSLKKEGAEVFVMMTDSATKFVSPLSLEVMSKNKVFTNESVWNSESETKIDHTTLAQDADLILVAPATANIMAKMVTGVSDEILLDTILASKAPVLVAPAMNTNMWEHQTTRRNIQVLKSMDYQIIEPDSGMLACGDIGQGRLAELDVIMNEISSLLSTSNQETNKGAEPSAQAAPSLTKIQQQEPVQEKLVTIENLEEEKPKSTFFQNARTGSKQAIEADSKNLETFSDLQGKKVVITVGATKEKIDPVRFITNKSSGKMGFALAKEALRQGAEVHLISTIDNGEAWLSATHFTKVETHEEMHKAVIKEFTKSEINSREADALIMVAAVADYRPIDPASTKIKKEKDDSSPIDAIVSMINQANDRAGNLVIEFEKTSDIIAELGSLKKAHQVVVGFSVETEDPIDNAKRKVKEKNLDFIVANSTASFGADEAEVSIIGSVKRAAAMPMITSLQKESKTLIANKVFEYINKCFMANNQAAV